MTREEIEELKGLAASMGLYDDRNPCKRAVILGKAIKILEQEPCEDAISRQAVLDMTICDGISCNECSFNTCEDGQSGCLLGERISKIPPVTPQPKTGHWSRKTKVDAYDIVGSKTWSIKCQCDRCDFTTIVVEDFGYYKYCPNCGCRMESESEEWKKNFQMQ